MDEVSSKLGDSVVFVDVQLGSSDYGSPSGDTVDNNTGNQSYVPAFWMVDAVVQNNQMSPAATAVTTAKSKYAALKTQGVTAHIAFEKSIASNKLTVNTQTKFFKQATGDYFVNIMLIESGFQASQKNGSGQMVTITAKRVLRRVFSGENGAGDAKFWNCKIASGTTPANTVVNKTFSTTLNSAWNQQNLAVVATIWTKSGSTNKAVSTEDKPGTIGGDLQAPVVDVTAPAANAVLQVGTMPNITWTATDNVGVVSRAIYFSSNNGTAWTKVDSAAGNTGTYQWTVPNNMSKQCKVKVIAYDAAGNAGNKESGIFEIAPAMSIISDPKIAGSLIQLKKTADGLMLYVPFSGEFSVTVSDVHGKMLSEFTGSGNSRWYALMNTCSPGMHIVRITTPGMSVVKKVTGIR